MSMTVANFSFYDKRGEKIGTVTDVISATWVRTTNALGAAMIDIDASCVDFLTFTQEDLGMLIEVTDCNGLPQPDMDTFWFLRGFSESRQSDLEVLSLIFEDSMSLLNRRIVSLRANTPEGSEPRTDLAGPGNVIMAETFTTITSLASFSRDWTANVSVAPIAVPSPLVEKEVPWKNLLQVMQQICRTSRDKGTPLYFDMIRVPPYNFRFTTFTGQRGKLHSEIINSENPLFILDGFSADYNVPNTGYVGGAGRGEARKLGFAQQPIEGTFNIFERYKSTNVSNQGALDDEAAEMVNATAGKVALSGTLLGELADRFSWGDRATIQHRDYIIECEITSVRNTLQDKVLDREIIVRSIE